uniref:Uncharacterized protein n=1 Tax=Sphaerodactylus townsendi TaxID=933632 RepID=A0ACB8E538_9SAUR
MLRPLLVKTTSDDESKQPAQGVTHAVKQPTHSPGWEEMVTVEIEARKAGEEGADCGGCSGEGEKLPVSHRETNFKARFRGPVMRVKKGYAAAFILHHVFGF